MRDVCGKGSDDALVIGIVLVVLGVVSKFFVNFNLLSNVVPRRSSLTAILAEQIVSMARFMFNGWANPIPSHLDDCASLDEPKTIS